MGLAEERAKGIADLLLKKRQAIWQETWIEAMGLKSEAGSSSSSQIPARAREYLASLQIRMAPLRGKGISDYLKAGIIFHHKTIHEEATRWATTCLRELCRRLGASPIDLAIMVSDDEYFSIAPKGSFASYDHVTKSIVFRETAPWGFLLHEACHHIQVEKMGWETFAEAYDRELRAKATYADISYQKQANEFAERHEHLFEQIISEVKQGKIPLLD